MWRQLYSNSQLPEGYPPPTPACSVAVSPRNSAPVGNRRIAARARPSQGRMQKESMSVVRQQGRAAWYLLPGYRGSLEVTDQLLYARAGQSDRQYLAVRPLRLMFRRSRHRIDSCSAAVGSRRGARSDTSLRFKSFSRRLGGARQEQGKWTETESSGTCTKLEVKRARDDRMVADGETHPQTCSNPAGRTGR